MVVACPFCEGLRPCLGELVEEVTRLVWRGGGRSETSQAPNSQQQSDKHESSGRGVLAPLSLGWGHATPSQVVMTLFRGHVQAMCACVQGGEVTCPEAMVHSYRVASVWSTAIILARSEAGLGSASLSHIRRVSEPSREARRVAVGSSPRGPHTTCVPVTEERSVVTSCPCPTHPLASARLGSLLLVGLGSCSLRGIVACGNKGGPVGRGPDLEHAVLCGEAAPEAWGLPGAFLEEAVLALTGETLAGSEASTQSHQETLRNLAQLPRAVSGCYFTSDTIF